MHANRMASFLPPMGVVFALLSLAVFAQGLAPAAAQAEARSIDEGKTMQRVTSRDGTRIAYEKAGKGPAVILVNGALAARSSGSELAQLLTPHFTVYSY